LSSSASSTISELPGIEIPSIEQIEKIEKLQKSNLESLVIIDNTVKCQRCGNFIAITTNNTPTFEKKGRRVATLRHKIRWIESHGYHNKTEDLKPLKQEYADLLAEDERADKLRNLNLISCKLTKWLYVCNNCFDRLSKRGKTLREKL
jgi:hypothetical protein